jgi:hypothetical protein
MTIALFALAAAMIVGGLMAAFLGWDIVLVERGWTMVIAGSVFASSGALLLGLAAAVSRLAKIQGELARLHADLREEEVQAEMLPAAVAASGLSVAALAGGLFGEKAAEVPAKDEPSPDQPPLPLFPETGEPERETVPEAERREERPAEPAVQPEPKLSPAREPEEKPEGAAEEPAPEVRVPDFLIVGRYRETTYTSIEEPEDDNLYAPEPADAAPEEAGQTTLADSGRREAAEPETEKAGETVEAEAEPAEEAREPEPADGALEAEDQAAASDEPSSAATIVGTYTSGDNRYVMFSDGSIEAETPQGVFRFQSLDELKEFIASGGEGPPAA